MLQSTFAIMQKSAPMSCPAYGFQYPRIRFKVFIGFFALYLFWGIAFLTFFLSFLRIFAHPRFLFVATLLLRIVNVLINLIRCNKFVVSAYSVDLAVVHDDDSVRTFDG